MKCNIMSKSSNMIRASHHHHHAQAAIANSKQSKLTVTFRVGALKSK